MKPKSRKNSPTIGAFIATAYGVCFPYDSAHHGGTDADHIVVIPGDVFPPDASHEDESYPQTTMPGNREVTPEHGLRPES